jgi:hypothetical protein
MTRNRWRITVASLLAAATVGATSPAHAAHPDRCERKLERIEDKFRTLEARMGWEAASVWWNEVAWPRYYRQCGG